MVLIKIQYAILLSKMVKLNISKIVLMNSQERR